MESGKPTPVEEVWFCWREFTVPEGEEAPRLVVPWSDPSEYEEPADYFFDTETRAEAWKTEEAPDEEWILCRLILSPLLGWKQCSKCNKVREHALDQGACVYCMEETHGRRETKRAEDETRQVRPGGA